MRADVAAKRLANALDAEDYASAGVLLSDSCEYICRGQTCMGRAAIMESYREAGEAARSEFAQITYLSDVTAVADGLARINFCDQLCHHGLSFTFECQQVIEVDPDGLIRRILHVDLPDQREALEEFRRRVAEASASDEANRLTDRCRSTDHE